MKWTNEQKNSIFAPPAQIVVSAAAGSGKTQVLTTRIIERIKNVDSPVSVEKLLIVTFTKAAAAEMKERIGKALRLAVKEEASPAVREYLKKQLMLLGSAQICTIDSFCYNVVKQNFFKADLPSDISIGESGELSLLRLSALEETVDTLYCSLEKSKGNTLSEENLLLAANFEACFPDKNEQKLILEGFEQLTNTCSYDKRDSEFSETVNFGGDYTTMISEIHKKAQSAAYPEFWLNNTAEMYSPENGTYSDTPVYAYAFTVCKETISNALRSIKNASEISLANSIGYEVTFDEDILALSALCEAKDYETLRELYKNLNLSPRIRGKKKNSDPHLTKQLQAFRKNIKDILSDTLSSLLRFSLKECNSLRELLYPQIKALCSAAILLDKLYYEKMTSRKIIDFSTCEHLALKIISEDGISLSEAGESLKNKFDEIYIDEFQDSNNLQDILFSLISKGKTFIVGDVKQSIYGFRNADPSIFMKKCDEASFEESSEKRKIFLSKNFRSSLGVINAVNSIFSPIMIPSVSSIDYNADHKLDFGASFMPESVPEEKCEITIIEKQGKSDEQKLNEANYIASEIKKLISSGRLVWDKDESIQRPIRYSDITVLLRSVSTSSAMFEEAFAESAIPYYIDGGNDLYETNEVGQIIEILKLIDNSKNDISLACTLRSPMFMFDENELLKIKLSSNESFHASFYGICSGKYKVEPALAKKCNNFMKKLSLWRKNSGILSVVELIRRIYNDTNIYSNVLSLPDGQMRRANLDLLLEKAEEFERSSYSGLFNFVTYVQKMKKTAESVSEAKSVSEKMNVVRIMTIHKSKGLEFPVVFLANCAKAYRGASSGPGGLIINNNAGIGINFVNPLLRYKYKSPMQEALLLMSSRDDMAEEMRLLYVALTRAREKLYVVATLNNLEAFENLCSSFLDEPTANEIFICKNYISLVALSYFHGADKFWKLNVITPCEREEKISEEINSDKAFIENSEVSRLLDYKYPFSEYINLPSKASVSFLKSLDVNLAPGENGHIALLNTPSCKSISFKTPEFTNKNHSGAFVGTAHHKFLQYYDYKAGEVKNQLTNMEERKLLTKEEAETVEIEKLELFFSSELGKMLKATDKIYREEPFVIKISACEIDSTFDKNETICIQGIIDCYFHKDDSTIVLVDYKTDKYENPKEIADKYSKQLYYYEMALKKKFNNKLIQKYLYLLHKNDIIEL